MWRIPPVGMNLPSQNFFPESVWAYMSPGKRSVATKSVTNGRCGTSLMPSCLTCLKREVDSSRKPKEETWCMLTARKIALRYSGARLGLCAAIAPKTIDSAMLMQPK
jgi:hypothetical protein